MKSVPAYLWRSAFSQRLYAAMTDPWERSVFSRLLAVHRLTEDELRAVLRRWVRDRHPRETLVRYLVRVRWPLPGFWRGPTALRSAWGSTRGTSGC